MSENNAADKSQKRVEEEPLSDNNAPQIKYDVFVSFRGKDIRRGFLSHLTEAFKRNQINAFVDDRIEKGEEIWPSLVGAIEGSSISLIIFSEDYAFSRWCLEELVKILECQEKYGQIVVPVFYGVEPTDVGHQSSESYKNAFAEHESKYETKVVQTWRDALKKTAKILGIVPSNRADAELVKEIVNLMNLMMKKLVKPAGDSKRLVEIDEKIAAIESLIRKESEHTLVIGIWGMGGLGKTTLAEEVFDKLRSEYDGSYFLVNERDQSNKHGIKSLKEELFSGLLGCNVKINTPNSLPENIVRRIGCMKVLIVLDDVNDSEHLEKLLGDPKTFGSGSRIIVTTRDEQVLNANNVDVIYQLSKLSFDKALELFNLNAFSQSDRQREYNELSKRMVDYAKGIPLVLKVLARHLCGKNKEFWESWLDKLQKMPPKEVFDILKLSYDDLDCKEQQIFLDLACFFLRLRRKVNVGNLKSLLKDGESDNSVVTGVERLKDKALITFSEDNSLQRKPWDFIRCEPREVKFAFMHDILQEMALAIVHRESSNPGSRSHLWDPDDIYEALKNNKGTELIRSIRIDEFDELSTMKKQKLSPQIFAKMSRLQFLEICGICSDDLSAQHCTLAKGLQFLETELKYLCWSHYPLKSLPENFSTERLVILTLRFGNMEKLWNGVKNLVNLKEVDLSWSGKLKKLPDLSKATNLEILILKYTKIKVLPSSFGHQSKLRLLDLNGSGIERLPSSISNLTQLLHINVSYCSKLQTIPELPRSLENLDFHGCKSLKTIPKLPLSLKTLNVDGCKSLKVLPELPLSLETLDVSDCESLETLPKLPLSLENLDVSRCTSLQTLPELPRFLKTLNYRDHRHFQTPPELHLSLETLDIKFCTSLQTLPKLPSSVKHLYVSFCESLQTLPELPLSLETLDTMNCTSLQTLPKLPSSLKTLTATDCKSLKTLPELPFSLKTLDVSYCESLQTILELPLSLETLCVSRYKSLQTLPELPFSLKTLDASSCESLQIIPELPLSLKTLCVSYCNSLQTLPELPSSLEALTAEDCKSLKTVLFPSAAVEQLKENRRRVRFLNCLDLDEHSLVAIGLNAQINLMKFANHHLSTPNHDHVENCSQYDYRQNHPSYHALYMYPGSIVAEWLEYRTTKDYIIINLSSPPPSPKLGFIFCFVLGNYQDTRMIGDPEVNLIISDDDGGSIKDSVFLYIPTGLGTIKSDHVCVVYDQRCSDFLNRRAKNQTSFKIQVQTIYGRTNILPQQVLKGFGVSPISTSTYSSFTQHMELLD